MSDMRLTQDSGEDFTNEFTFYGPHNGILVIRNHTEHDRAFSYLNLETPNKTWPILEPGVGLRTTLDDELHVIRAGEAIPIHVGPLEVSEERRKKVEQGCLTALIDFPGYLGDLTNTMSRKGLPWLMERKGDPYSKDPVDLQGWIQPYMVWDGDGAANARYNQVLHSIQEAVLTEARGDMALALATGFAHACTGYFTVGKYAGLPRPEKGQEAYGEMGDRPLWSKTWPEQLWALKCYTGHPYVEWLWGQFLVQLFDTRPSWWDGKWGARGPARYLDSLLLAHHVGTEGPDSVWARSAAIAIKHYKTLLDPATLLWVNGSLKNTSPWMICQLITSIARWSKILDLDTTWLHEVAENLATKYTKDYGVFYRCDGPDAHVKYRTTSAWAYRCAKELGYHDHAQGFYDYSIGTYDQPGVSLDGSRGSNFLKDVLIMLQNCIDDYSGFGEMGE